MFCANCGTQFPDEGAFCPNCGTPANAAFQQPAQPVQPVQQQPETAPVQPAQPQPMPQQPAVERNSLGVPAFLRRPTRK